jgi:hypothetical protein
VEWTDVAENADKLQADVDPVIEPLVFIKFRISCVGGKFRPKKDLI